MDGVITDTMPYHYQAWKIILKDYNIHASRFDIYTREGQPGIQAVYEIFDTYKQKISKTAAYRVLQEKESCFKKIVKQRFIRGSRTFLKQLSRKGMTLALVTGTARHETIKILPPRLLNMFSVVITGSDVKCGKPHPEPYLKALKRLDLTPDETIVIENAPFGIISAKKAGLKCIALETSLPKDYLKAADIIFSGYKELNAHMDIVRM